MAAERDDEHELRLLILTVTGVKFTVWVNGGTTVLAVKETVEEKQGIDVNLQRLVVAMKGQRKKVELEDDQTVADAGLKNGHKVFLIRRMSEMTLWHTNGRYVYERGIGDEIKCSSNMTIADLCALMKKPNASKILFYAYKTNAETDGKGCVWTKCHHLSFDWNGDPQGRMQNSEKCFHGPIEGENTLGSYNVAEGDSFWMA